MSTSLRIDTTELIPGALVIGDTGGGVKGSSIPSTGDNGPGYAYNDLSLPADNDKEIMGRVLSYPSAGTLVTYEDTSFVFTGAPDGSYSFTYQLYVDYVPVGSPATVTLNIGDLSATLTSSSSLVAGLTTTIRLNAGLAASSNLSASLDGSINLSSNLFSVSSITAELTTNQGNLQGSFSCSSTLEGELTTQISLGSAMAAISSLQATLTNAGSGAVQAGDRLTIEFLGKEYTITLV